jgi:hypothetical protein
VDTAVRTVTIADDDVAQPAKRMKSTIAARWRAFKRYTRLVKLTIRARPAGSKLTVECRRKPCAFKTRRLTFPALRKRIEIAGLFNPRRKLRAGTVVTIRITAPGLIGRFAEFRVRSGRPPKRTSGCLAPGSGVRTPC